MTQSLDMTFLDEKCCLKGSYAYAIELHEGISIPFKAKIILHSQKSFSNEKLKTMLKTKASFKVCQFVEDTVIRCRDFNGIITSYVSMGRISKGIVGTKEVSCFAYEITIEPSIVLLSLKKKTHTYSYISISEIIKQLCKSNNVEYDLSNDLFDYKFTDKHFIFEQSDETDLAFLNRLCSKFGINYSFSYVANDNSHPLVFFSRGWNTDNKTHVYDATAVKSDTKTDYSMDIGDENDLNISITSPSYPASNTVSCSIGNDKHKNIISSVEFRGEISKNTIYEDDVNFDSIKHSIYSDGFLINKKTTDQFSIKALENLCISSYVALQENTRDILYANSSNLIYAPGIHICINNLDDIDGDCKGEDKFIVIRNSFSFNKKFSSKFYNNGTFPTRESNLKQEFSALYFRSEAKTLGSLCKLDFLPLEKNNEDQYNLFSSIENKQKNTFNEDKRCSSTDNVFVGTVCNKDGKESPLGGIAIPAFGDTAFPSMFYAKLPNEKDIITVQHVSKVSSIEPLGNFPRIGQSVLLFKSNNVFYFGGFIASDFEMNSFNANLRNVELSSTKYASHSDEISLESRKDDKDKEIFYVSTKLKNDLSRDLETNCLEFMSFDSDEVLIMHHILQGSINRLIDGILNSEKDLSLINKYKKDLTFEIGDKKLVYKDVATALNQRIINDRSTLKEKYSVLSKLDQNKRDDAYFKADKEYIEAKNQLDSSYELLNNFSKKIIELFKGDSGYVEHWSFSQALLNSNGDVSVFAKENLGLYADKVVSVLSDGKIFISAEDKISISSDQGIDLQVQNSSVSLDANSVSINVNKFGNDLTPWDGSITVDALSGVSVNGPSVSMNGMFSAAMTDSFGGSLETSGSAISIGGSKVKLETLDKEDVIFLMTDSISAGIGATKSLIDKLEDRTALNAVNFTFPTLLPAAYDIAKCCYKTHKKIHDPANEPTKLDKALAVVNAAFKVADVLEKVIEAGVITLVSEKTEKNRKAGWTKRHSENGYISKKDVYKLTMFSLQKAAMLGAILPSLYKCMTGESGSIAIAPNHTSIKGVAYEIKFEEGESNISVVAGKSAKVQPSVVPGNP